MLDPNRSRTVNKVYLDNILDERFVQRAPSMLGGASFIHGEVW